jgi:hypothetical protein
MIFIIPFYLQLQHHVFAGEHVGEVCPSIRAGRYSTWLLSCLTLFPFLKTAVRSFVMWVCTISFLYITGNDIIGKREHWPILFGRAIFGFASVSFHIALVLFLIISV